MLVFDLFVGARRIAQVEIQIFCKMDPKIIHSVSQKAGRPLHGRAGSAAALFGLDARLAPALVARLDELAVKGGAANEASAPQRQRAVAEEVPEAARGSAAAPGAPADDELAAKATEALLDPDANPFLRNGDGDVLLPWEEGGGRLGSDRAPRNPRGKRTREESAASAKHTQLLTDALGTFIIAGGEAGGVLWDIRYVFRTHFARNPDFSIWGDYSR